MSVLSGGWHALGSPTESGVPPSHSQRIKASLLMSLALDPGIGLNLRLMRAEIEADDAACVADAEADVTSR